MLHDSIQCTVINKYNWSLAVFVSGHWCKWPQCGFKAPSSLSSSIKFNFEFENECELSYFKSSQCLWQAIWFALPCFVFKYLPSGGIPCETWTEMKTQEENWWQTSAMRQADSSVRWVFCFVPQYPPSSENFKPGGKGTGLQLGHRKYNQPPFLSASCLYMRQIVPITLWKVDYNL